VTLRAGMPWFDSRQGQGFSSSSQGSDRPWSPTSLLFIEYGGSSSFPTYSGRSMKLPQTWI